MPKTALSDGRLPTVLLIDDDLVSREVTATLLTMSGFAVHTAPDGGAALALLENEALEPGLVLMDDQMPGLHGRELMVRLRALSKAPIAVISASQPPQETVAAADGVLIKPFGADQVCRILAEWDSREPAANPLADDAGAELPVVRAEILAQFRDAMPEAGVKQLYNAVIVDLHRRVAALDAALARGDEDEVRRIGHAIKGGCGMAGALAAARLGALIEAGAFLVDGNQLDNRAAMLSDLRDAAERLERMLEAEFPA